jgi:hypothetical protein
MLGHVVKRGVSQRDAQSRSRPWAYVLEFGMGADGKRHQQWQGGFATKREATEAMKSELAARHADSHAGPTR